MGDMGSNMHALVTGKYSRRKVQVYLGTALALKLGTGFIFLQKFRSSCPGPIEGILRESF